MEANGTGMTADQVFALLDAFQELGCWFSLERGWGVDALVRAPDPAAP